MAWPFQRLATSGDGAETTTLQAWQQRPDSSGRQLAGHDNPAAQPSGSPAHQDAETFQGPRRALQKPQTLAGSCSRRACRLPGHATQHEQPLHVARARRCEMERPSSCEKAAARTTLHPPAVAQTHREPTFQSRQPDRFATRRSATTSQVATPAGRASSHRPQQPPEAQQEAMLATHHHLPDHPQPVLRPQEAGDHLSSLVGAARLKPESPPNHPLDSPLARCPTPYSAADDAALVLAASTGVGGGGRAGFRCWAWRCWAGLCLGGSSGERLRWLGLDEEWAGRCTKEDGS